MRAVFVAAFLWTLVAYVYATQTTMAEPTSVLDKRQAVGGAALGGGGGQPDDLQTESLQSISGYTPPASSTTPTPSNFKSGKILQPSEINGYDDAIRFAKSPATVNTISLSMFGLVAVVVGGVVLL
ncbi:Hypothetical protein MSYG_3509 [Malassezia sympodialis ATCC 42132]|uniref:Uncharacterized protein n=1 Tax=Malassezia sympodialis (strain ATCC 42132) TaxID=1230383 RepID=A0A1M8A9N2_MALS4|nr:Hypothetical protein MSYG_3509 [Malassezia sympodialis ATCC 42132]